VELVDAVEFVLDPDGLARRRGSEPHVAGGYGMLIVLVEARAVDGVLGP
jgi:hypothetical protein